MKILKRFLWICNLVFIYYMSSQNGNDSTSISNGFITYMYSFISNLTNLNLNEFINLYSDFIRTLAHFTEFFFLGIFTYLNLKDFIKHDYAIFSCVFCIMYSILDEVHQLFVSQRAFEFKDIMIDSFGSIAGIFLIHLLIYAIRKYAKRKSS